MRDAGDDGFRITRQNLLEVKEKDDKYFGGKFWGRSVFLSPEKGRKHLTHTKPVQIQDLCGLA